MANREGIHESQGVEEMAKSRNTIPRDIHGYDSGNPTGRCHYASNNRAKLPLELSLCIDRALLKGRYGEGFGGAPLCTSPATHRLATGVRGRHDEPYEQSSTNVGGNDH